MVYFIAEDIKAKERQRQAFRLQSVHDDASAKINSSIDNFATLVSGMRSYLEQSPTFPNGEEMQQFVNILLEDIDYQDSIIVSFLDTTHTFQYTFTRNLQDPAGLVGVNVSEIRDEEEIRKLNAIMKDHDLHMFEPINLVEGWAGIPLNFAVRHKNEVIGYMASLINFRTIIDPIYDNPDVTEDFTFNFSVVGGPQFDRETVYDGSKVYNASKDSEFFGNFDVNEEEVLYSEIIKYGTTFQLGTAYKDAGSPARMTIWLIYSWYLTIALLLSIIARQVLSVQNMNRRLEKAIKIAEKSSEAKDTFLVNMSHEIRTPLNAIIGFASLLDDTELSETQSKYTRTISMASENLLALINDVLDISKIESGHIELEVKAFALRDVLNNIIRINSQAASNKKLKLLLTVDEEVPENVMGDSARLTQILLNLVSNAIKFTHEGSIEIKAALRSQKGINAGIEFSVQDSGIGISNDKVDRIFKRFTQAESSTTREYGGTGLGLSIVKALVEIQGGEIDVISQVGLGTKFTFVLNYPVADASAKEEKAVRSTNPDQSLLEGKRILLVEDNEHNQILATTYLHRNKAQVDLCVNGREAIEILQEQNPYDCILMDLQMPQMDGFEATEIIRGELELETPIIACTAHFLASEKTRSLNVGMNDYITKPYAEKQLVETILSVISTMSFSPQPEVEVPKEEDNIRDILAQMAATEGSDLVEAMLSIFNSRIPGDITDLEDGLEAGDMITVHKKAHLLSGSLGSLRFMQGHSMAKALEIAARADDENAAAELTGNLVAYLESALVETNRFQAVQSS